ncbi:MAG: copper transporter [Bacillota bacterium]
MNDYREYCIAIAAIFLALALGIMIGVSFGDDFLVSNQREMIERMESELMRLRGITQEKEGELERWEAVKPLIWRGYREIFAGKKIAVVADNEAQAALLKEVLVEAGAAVTILLLTPENGQVSAAAEFPEKIYEYVCQSVSEEAADSAPHCIVLLMGRGRIPGRLDTLFLDAWQSLEGAGARVIAAFPREEQVVLPSCAGEVEWSLIDNVNTFWGQLALLEMAATGERGHYGFRKEAIGLIPLAPQ